MPKGNHLIMKILHQSNFKPSKLLPKAGEAPPLETHSTNRSMLTILTASKKFTQKASGIPYQPLKTKKNDLDFLYKSLPSL